MKIPPFPGLDEAQLRCVERNVLEACITLEAWHHGQYEDRAALRQLRAQLRVVGDILAGLVQK